MTNTNPKVKQTSLCWDMNTKMERLDCFHINPETILHYTGQLWYNFYQKQLKQDADKKKLEVNSFTL